MTRGDGEVGWGAERDELVARLGYVLAGIRFPVTAWQLVAHADHYGADRKPRSELQSLPSRSYPNLVAVVAAIRASGQHTSRDGVSREVGRG